MTFLLYETSSSFRSFFYLLEDCIKYYLWIAYLTRAKPMPDVCMYINRSCFFANDKKNIEIIATKTQRHAFTVYEPIKNRALRHLSANPSKFNIKIQSHCWFEMCFSSVYKMMPFLNHLFRCSAWMRRSMDIIWFLYNYCTWYSRL